MRTRSSQLSSSQSDLSFKAIFFFNDTATTEIYTLSLHDALPISRCRRSPRGRCPFGTRSPATRGGSRSSPEWRSEEHTSELQSRSDLVCRLLLEKKKTTTYRRRRLNAG